MMILNAFRTWRNGAALAATLLCLAGVVLLGRAASDNSAPLAAVVLEATDALRWYRGNLHTHSLWSDGDDFLEMIGSWYRARGYDFLCFTDHNVLATSERWIDVDKAKGGRKAFEKLKAKFPEGWVEQRTVDEKLQVRLKRFPEVAAKLDVPGKFLLIQGEEISDAFNKRPIHLNATNIGEAIPPMHGDSVADAIQNNVDAVIAQRERTGRPILVHLNHPNFGWGVTAEDLMRIRGEKFFEVYNGHPGVRNSGDKDHASAERIWDILLTRRIAEFGLPLMYAMATDDGHNYHGIPSRASEPGRGWVVVLSDELSPHRLIAAMEAGRFYASNGVALERVESSPTSLAVRVKPEQGVTYRIEFVGTRKGYDPESQPVLDKEGKELAATRRYSDDIGRVLKHVEGTEATYEFTGDELYVRARVVSTKPHPNPSEPGDLEQAWVQPVLGPAAGKSP